MHVQNLHESCARVLHEVGGLVHSLSEDLYVISSGTGWDELLTIQN